MSDETIISALGGLRSIRMSGLASDRVRDELETSWTARPARARSRRFMGPLWLRPAAAAVIMIVAALVTLRSGADSPLYSLRVAVEDALVTVQADPVAYITALYDERLEEATRFEASGNALAASRARQATSDALRLLGTVAPKPSDETPPEPTASTVIALPPSPTSAPSASPSDSPSPVPALVTTTTAPRTPTPRPATPKPAPTPSPTPFTLHVGGTAVYPDGTLVNDACVSTTFGGSCVAMTTNGAIDLWIVARAGDTVTLYLQKADVMTGRTYRGKTSATVSGPSLLIGRVTLKLI